jgi:hypothetical protein
MLYPRAKIIILLSINTILLFPLHINCEETNYKYQRENGVWGYTDNIKKIPENVIVIYSGDYGNWTLIDKKEKTKTVEATLPPKILVHPNVSQNPIVETSQIEGVNALANKRVSPITFPHKINIKRNNNLGWGFLFLIIGSIMRGWGLLNYRRGPSEAAVIATGSVFTFLSLVSIVLGLIGCIIIGIDTSAIIGLILFLAFFFLSRIWIPVLKAFGL